MKVQERRLEIQLNSPIGVFDSGLGGLSVVKQLIRKLPSESIVYFADEAHVPYGEKPLDEIRGFALGITDFLLQQGGKIIVMACNMSSATALDAARERFKPVPVLGVIDAGVRAAARVSRGNPVGVLATTGTVKSGAYTRSMMKLHPEVKLVEQACPSFVPLVESGMTGSDEAFEAAKEYVKPLLSAGCGTLILGCTHYPFLLDAIRSAAGADVTIVDPAVETAEEAADLLKKTGMESPAHTEPAYQYYTSANPEKFVELGGQFLAKEICNIQVATWGMDLREIQWQETMEEKTMNSAR